MVTFCAIIMLSKPFANLSSNNSAFNDEVSHSGRWRVSSEGCCRPTRVMSVTKRSGSKSQSLLRSHWLLLHWNDLIDHICGSINVDPARRGLAGLILPLKSDMKNTVSVVYRHIKKQGAFYET